MSLVGNQLISLYNTLPHPQYVMLNTTNWKTVRSEFPAPPPSITHFGIAFGMLGLTIVPDDTVPQDEIHLKSRKGQSYVTDKVIKLETARPPDVERSD